MRGLTSPKQTDERGVTDCDPELAETVPELAARLTDSVPTDRIAANLHRLEAIAAAFRAVDERAASQRPCLFEWRHLRVEAEIGEGGFGKVYRAWDPTLRRAVALKLVREDLSSNLQEQLLIAEAQRMARVRHPNILAIHGADQADGRTGIWSDLLEGRTLADRIKRDGPMTAGALIELALPLAEALTLVHRRGMTHGDVKPANVMIEPDGTPVLMDFGSVHEALGGSTQVGSPLAMAPEQFRHAPPSPATDMYAFGIVLYFAMTGRYAVEASSLDQLIEKHKHSEEVRYSAVNRTWRPVLRRLLHVDPSVRWDAGKCVERLLLMKGARARRRRRVAVGSVLVSLLLAAAAATLGYRSALRSQERTELVKDVLVDAVEASLPTAQSGPASIEALYSYLEQEIEPRLTDYPDALAEMRLVVGRGFGELGQPERGIQIARDGPGVVDPGSARFLREP